MSVVQVRDIMVRSVHLCLVTDSLELPIRKMMEHGIGCVLVVDADGRLTGMLTDRDICIAAFSKHQRLLELTVGNHMTQTVRYGGENDAVSQATEQMLAHRIRRLPIVDDARRPVAVLTLGDIARAFRRFDLQHQPVEAAVLLKAAGEIG